MSSKNKKGSAQVAQEMTEVDVTTEVQAEEKSKGPKEIKRVGYSEPTKRTATQFPIVETRPESVSPKKRTSSVWARLLTWKVTEKHTQHAQENGLLLKDFLNADFKLSGDQEIRGVTWASGNYRFFTRYKEVVFDLKAGDISEDAFLATYPDKFLGAMIELTAPAT